MKKLLLLALVTSVQAQDFSVSAIPLNHGNVYVINSTYVATKPVLREEPNERLRRVNEKLSESIASMRSEYYANQQVNELRRQTRLLEEIANK